MSTPSASSDFRTILTVRVGDLNYGGHLGNDRIVGYFQEIRVRWLQQFGWTELDVAGVGILQTELAVRYRRQAFLGDMLEGLLGIEKVKTRGVDLAYTLLRTSDQKVIAEGSTGLIFFDYATQQVTHTPEAFAALAAPAN